MQQQQQQQQPGLLGVQPPQSQWAVPLQQLPAAPPLASDDNTDELMAQLLVSGDTSPATVSPPWASYAPPATQGGIGRQQPQPQQSLLQQQQQASWQREPQQQLPPPQNLPPSQQQHQEQQQQPQPPVLAQGASAEWDAEEMQRAMAASLVHTKGGGAQGAPLAGGYLGAVGSGGGARGGRAGTAAGEWTSAGAGLGRGLTNETGEYNCFLNVVVQALWHVEPFRRAGKGPRIMQASDGKFRFRRANAGLVTDCGHRASKQSR